MTTSEAREMATTAAAKNNPTIIEGDAELFTQWNVYFLVLCEFRPRVAQHRQNRKTTSNNEHYYYIHIIEKI
jgi:hypothetical protein